MRPTISTLASCCAQCINRILVAAPHPHGVARTSDLNKNASLICDTGKLEAATLLLSDGDWNATATQDVPITGDIMRTHGR